MWTQQVNKRIFFLWKTQMGIRITWSGSKFCSNWLFSISIVRPVINSSRKAWILTDESLTPAFFQCAEPRFFFSRVGSGSGSSQSQHGSACKYQHIAILLTEMWHLNTNFRQRNYPDQFKLISPNLFHFRTLTFLTHSAATSFLV